MGEHQIADIATWRTQLVELNARSRMYSTRLWAVPFTYAAIVGAVVHVFLTNGRLNTVSLAVVTAVGLSMLGAVVLWIYCGILGAVRKVVCDIRTAEKELELPPTAESKHPGIDRGYGMVVVLALFAGWLPLAQSNVQQLNAVPAWPLLLTFAGLLLDILGVGFLLWLEQKGEWASYRQLTGIHGRTEPKGGISRFPLFVARTLGSCNPLEAEEFLTESIPIKFWAMVFLLLGFLLQSLAVACYYITS